MTMLREKAFIWIDPSINHIEVVLGQDPGLGEMITTQDSEIQLRMDDTGRIIGIWILSIRGLFSEKAPVDIQLDADYLPVALDELARTGKDARTRNLIAQAWKQKAFLHFDGPNDQIHFSFGLSEGLGKLARTNDERVLLRIDDEGRITGVTLLSVASLMRGEDGYELEVSPLAESYSQSLLD